MQTILMLLLLMLVSLLLFLQLKKTVAKNPQDETLRQWLLSMQKTIIDTNATMQETVRLTSGDVTGALRNQSVAFTERLESATRVISDLNKQVGELSEVGRGIKSLQEFLQSPKLRGNIGEQVMSDMIGQAFPRQLFVLQYTFSSGNKVDAVLKTDAGLLCIDSKFPMDSFLHFSRATDKQDKKESLKEFELNIKKHIMDISNKYILPAEGTLDFALMYIPAESVYSEIVANQTIMEYSRSVRVYPVSPNTLYAHLQILLLSFQGKELEKKTREVMHIFRALSKDHEKLHDSLGVLQKHITNSYNVISVATQLTDTIGQKLHTAHELTDGT